MRLPDYVYFAADAAKRWERSSLGRRHHAGQRMQPAQQLLVKPLFFDGRSVLAARERQAREQDVLRTEAQVHLLQLDETAHQQPSARQQHQRQRHFEHHQRVPQPSPPETAAGAFAGVFQRLDQVFSDRLQRRRQAEKHGGADRRPQTEKQDGEVQSNLGFARDEAIRNQRHQPLDAGVREEAAHNRSAEREQQTLGQQLADQSHPAGAQRRANRHLFLTRRRARQQHVGHITARDQQQQADGGGDRVKRLAKLPDQAVNPTDDLDAEVLGIVVGIDLRQPPRYQLYIGLRLLGGDAGLQFRLKHPEIAVGARVAALYRPDYPNVRAQLGEARRHDPNQRRRRPVERESLAQNARIQVEALDPQFVGHHEDRRRARLGVVRRDAAAELRRHAQEAERVGRDIAAAELLHPVATVVEHVAERAADDLSEHVVLLLVIEEFRRLEESAPARTAAGRIVNLNGDHAARIRVRERVQQNVLDSAEDGGGRADAQRQCQHGNQRKAGLLQ